MADLVRESLAAADTMTGFVKQRSKDEFLADELAGDPEGGVYWRRLRVGAGRLSGDDPPAVTRANPGELGAVSGKLRLR